jgi:hypothetical protein
MFRRGPGVPLRRNPYADDDTLTIQLAHRQKLIGGDLARFALDARAKYGSDVALAAMLKLVDHYVAAGR